MFRRALIGAYPALLALAFLFGSPAHGASGIQATSAEWSASPGETPSAQRALYEETNDSCLNRRIDDQDEPDRIARVGSIIDWPPFASSAHCCLADPMALRTHAACAAPPRGPPAA